MDVSNAHEVAIGCILYWQITGGTAPDLYSPEIGVSRAQMAAFVARFVTVTGGRLPVVSDGVFHDDDGSVHEPAINGIAAAGIADGTGPGRFDPDRLVTRSQMSAFIVRAIDYRLQIEGLALEPGDVPDYFMDDDGDTHEESINKVASLAIVAGFADGLFGPGEIVHRDQMASFLARSLAYLVERGVAEVPDRPPA